jgi:hypothetical protein
MFSCGLIRGALANLGVASIVSADIPALPTCKAAAPMAMVSLTLCRYIYHQNETVAFASEAFAL